MSLAEPHNDVPCEVDVPTARELLRLKIATVIDVRQPFELQLEGQIAGAESIPLFSLKKLLGHVLNEEEQEVLDGDIPTSMDIQGFLALINQHHYQMGNVLLCLCNSGKRSLHAALLLRSIGYSRAFSVSGGVRRWRVWESIALGGQQDDVSIPDGLARDAAD
ncbi:MAG: rhodanese-like domain-containing protein [Acidiferrobacteraceae bacterium]